MVEASIKKRVEMAKLSPVKRKKLIQNLRQCGFDGPYSGGNHSFMKRELMKVRIPNTDIAPELLRRILKQAGISEKEWEKLG